MSFKRILAIFLIFVIACCGWSILGTSMLIRTEGFSYRLDNSVKELWGGRIEQHAPVFSYTVPGTNQLRLVAPIKNDINVKLNLEHRKKGLIWYPTYECDFSGKYEVINRDDVSKKVKLSFQFPDKNGTYDAFSVSLNGKALSNPVNPREGIREMVEVGAGEKLSFDIAYKSRGMDAWLYMPQKQLGRIQGFKCQVQTNFADYDFVDGSLSPMDPGEQSENPTLLWQANDLLTTQSIGIIMPDKLNPGPLVTRITYFAPVCLLFFFVLVATINVIYKVNIHPMHYLFVASGFFAFHLLLSYLVDIIDINMAFSIAALVTVFLVTSYLSTALKKFPWKVALAGQIFFLILFSYSFFFKGITGLTVSVGSVVTLAILMRVTAKLDWNEVFSSKKEKSPLITGEAAQA